MIKSLIAYLARREFARTVTFQGDRRPDLPACQDQLPRLLYLHIPFCERLCPYCSFNRVVFEEDLCRAYFQTLRKEIRFYKDRGYNFSSIYVGGGTPTLLLEELEETLALTRELFPIRNISVETNPNHLNDITIGALKRLRVNRLSVGVQSFHNGLLKEMDRYDKYGSGEEIALRLKDVMGEFETVNADMIFNFPSQTMEMLEGDLSTLIDIGIDQITYYPLMVSDHTKEEMETKLGRVDYRKEEAFYHRIVKGLVPAYRFSSAWCFSRTKAGSIIDEYIVDYDEYAGLGSGSIGYLGGTCYANTFSVPQYIATINEGKLPLMASRDFSLPDKVRYDFLMKLFGMKLPASFLFKKYGKRAYPGIFLDIAAFFIIGALKYDSGYFQLTRKGSYLWVIMMREFFTSVNNFRDYCRRDMVK